MIDALPIDLGEGHGHVAGKCSRVLPGNSAALLVVGVEVAQLDAQDRSLQLVEATVCARSLADEAPLPPVFAQHADPRCELLVIGHDHPAITHRSQILRRVKAETPHIPPSTDPSASVERPMGLSAVFDYQQLVSMSKVKDPVQVCGLAEQVNRYDGPCARRNHPLNLGRIDEKSFRFYVGQ